MPIFEHDVCFRRSTEITKSLRARDSSLLSLIPTARRLLQETTEQGPINCFFPRRDEWLLEWLVQRLKEEDGSSGQEARLSPQCWRLACDLLRSVSTGSVAATLRRHGILTSVGKLMAELRSRLEELHAKTAVCEVSGSSTSLELPIVPALLSVVAETLDYLRAIARSEPAILVALKLPPELAANIFGDFLAVCTHAVNANLDLEQTWVSAIVALWQTSIWGYSDHKKICVIWSEKCLCNATRLLTTDGLQSSIRYALEDMIAQYTFSPSTLSSRGSDSQTAADLELSAVIMQLLAPLKASKIVEPGRSFDLAVLFRIAVGSNRTGSKRVTAEYVDAVFKGLLLSRHGVDLASTEDTTISISAVADVISLMDELDSCGLSLPSSTIAQIVRQTGRLGSARPDEIRWDIIGSLLKLDFDTFLNPAHSDLTDCVFAAASRSVLSPDLERALSLLVSGFAKARNLLGFVEKWQNELARQPDHSVWTCESLSEAFGAHVETSLIPSQVIRLVDSLWNAKDLVILDATLRGVANPETESRISEAVPFSDYFTFAANASQDWRFWRVSARLGSLQPELLSGMATSAMGVIRVAADCSAVFAAEVLLNLAHRTQDPITASALIQQISASWACHADWDGSLVSVEKSTFAYVASLVLLEQHLLLLEMVESSTRNAFMDSFLHAALQSEQVKTLWFSMLENSNFYELASLKDSALAALTATLIPYNGMSNDMGSALEAAMKSSPALPSNAGFLLSSICRYPLEAIKRQFREKLLDILLIMHVAGHRSAVMSLMHKLCNVGNATAYLAESPRAFEAFFVAGPSDIEVAKKVIRHAVSNKDQQKTRQYLQELNTMATEKSKQQPDMCAVIVTELWDVRHLEEVNKDGALESLRRNLMKSLQKQINAAQDLAHCAQYIQLWRHLWQLEREDREDALRLAATLSARVARASSTTVEDYEEVIRLLCAVSESLDEISKTTALVINIFRNSPHSAQASALSSFRGMMDRQDIGAQITLALWLLRGCVELAFEQSWPWELLREAISSMKKLRPDDHPELLEKLSRLLRRLTLCLANSSTQGIAECICICVDKLLQTHPNAFTQYDVECTLSALNLALSPRAPWFNATQPDKLFTGLIRIFSTLLSLHRHRIRRRYHLATEIIQSFLSSLFTAPPLRRKVQNTAAIRASWLGEAELSVNSARAFARILQVFCEPPVSTVRTRGTVLTDSERTKEKRCVSKTIGPVLECYVRNLLDNRISPDVRKEVGVGIEAALGVLGRNGLQKVVAGMGSEGRAVVRSLWAAYSRTGRERV